MSELKLGPYKIGAIDSKVLCAGKVGKGGSDMTKRKKPAKSCQVCGQSMGHAKGCPRKGA